jgi:hypothetical protein
MTLSGIPILRRNRAVALIGLRPRTLARHARVGKLLSRPSA